jgi:hypothetical protein
LTTKAIPFLTASLQTRQVRIVGRHCTAVILILISGNAIAQLPLARRDPVLDQEKAIALKVEDRAHIANIELQTKVPEIRIDAGPSLSFYGMGKGNVVHEEHWENVPPPEQASFNRWAAYAADEPTGKALFEDMFYRFFFVHELGHWMQDEVLRQRKDQMARQADKNSETARWQYETVANRISVAWWREHDPQYLAKLVNDFRAIQEKLPNPVPSGESPKVFFTREYKKISDDPNAYGWFQLQMVILAYDDRPILSFQQAIDQLPSENYGG